MTEQEESRERARLLVQRAIEDYVEKRIAYYSRRDLLKDLLRKDHLIFALKGARSANDWLTEALNAHESSSEETMMGNSWQQILGNLSRSVGAGDLLVEKDDMLWVVEMKSQTNTLNAVSLAQTVRSLRRKVLDQQQPRTPGRRGVFAMIGVIRGPAADSYLRYSATTRENADIDGFQYRYIVGAPFRAWLTGLSNPAELISDWRDLAERMGQARDQCRIRVLSELVKVLSDRKLPLDVNSILILSAEADPRSAASDG
jgi:hypothetical protein